MLEAKGPEALNQEIGAKAEVMRRDVPDALWRFFSSRRLTLILLTAIALVFCFGAVFPQIDSGIAADSAQDGLRYADLRARYLQWTDLLGSLGLFNLYGSLWLKLPLFLMILNLTVCSVERFQAAVRSSRDPAEEFEETFPASSDTRTFVVYQGLRTAADRLRALLEEHHYKVQVRQREQGIYLNAERFALGKWGAPLTHGTLVLAMSGLLLSAQLGWREQGIQLSPGQMHEIRHTPSLSLCLDDFEAEVYPDGTPRTYWARLILLDGENEVARGTAQPNAPFVSRGIAFYLRSHGPAIRITARGDQGEPIAVQALVPGGTLGAEAMLQLSEQENEGYVAVPEENLVLRLALHTHPSAPPGGVPTLLVQAYRGGMTDLVFSDTLLGSAGLQIEGNRYTLKWDHYAVLTVARDPGFLPTVLGLVSLLAAVVIGLYVPPRRIWAAVSGKEDVVEMQLMMLRGEDTGGGAREFDVLMAEIEDSL